MRQVLPLVLVAVPVWALASDHNNLDKERPLRFDDAYSIAYRAFEFQNGLRLDGARRRATNGQFRSELQYGFAKNRDISIGLEPTYDGASRRASLNVLEFSYFEGVRRETERQPAFGYRVDLELPADRQTRGLGGRARAIWTKAARQYDKLHLNLDANVVNGELRPGAVLGYSVPLGFPTSFDTTLLAEFGAERRAASWMGIGIRRQVSTVGVLDLGVQVLGGSGEARFTLGFSRSF